MDGAYFKTYQMKMCSQLFQIRTIYTLLLVYSQSDDRSTISPGSPTTQTGNRERQKSFWEKKEEKKKRSKCLLAYLCCKEKGA